MIYLFIYFVTLFLPLLNNHYSQTVRARELTFREDGLISVKEEGRKGFPRAGWLLQGICRGRSPREIPRSTPYSTVIYILFLIGFRIGPPKMHKVFRIGFLRSIDGSVLALLKCLVLALLRLPSIFSHQNSTDEEFY